MTLLLLFHPRVFHEFVRACVSMGIRPQAAVAIAASVLVQAELAERASSTTSTRARRGTAADLDESAQSDVSLEQLGC